MTNQFSSVTNIDSAVGKSSIVHAVKDDTVSQSYQMKIGFDFSLLILILNIPSSNAISDNCGQKYISLIVSFYRNTHLT